MSLVNGAKVAELRREKGWKQKQLAAAAGVAPAVVSRLERGLQSDYSLNVIVAVATALEVSIDTLLDRSDHWGSGVVVSDLRDVWALLSQQPEPVQRQVVGMVRGFLSTLK